MDSDLFGNPRGFVTAVFLGIISYCLPISVREIIANIVAALFSQKL